MAAAAWDLTALVNAADPKASQAERHLWLARWFEWLRHGGPRDQAETKTPLPVLRVRHVLNLLDSHPELKERLQALFAAFWRDADTLALFSDFGFGMRQSLASEVVARLQARWLPATPETADLAALFGLLARPEDADWLDALDADTLRRLAGLLSAPGWRTTLANAITILASAVHSNGYAPQMRLRMDPALLRDDPFRQLAATADTLRAAIAEQRLEDALREATYLRALVDACRRASASVRDHLELYGISVDIIFELEQMRRRCTRIELLLDCLLAPDPGTEWRRLLSELARSLEEQRGLRALLSRNYSMLARRVAVRNAETGEHYITRDRAEYRDMLARAAGGGAVIAGTTFVKFGIAALGLTAFWTGFWSGANYAVSFVIVMLLHWTVATKQPAMTAPALASSVPAGDEASDEAVEGFVDRVAQLIRSQSAGIFGNLALCGPLVLAAQWLASVAFGAPLVGEAKADHVLDSLTLLGPTALFAAFTGVLLFASSLVAGWAENWFVFHRLDSALAWNPRIVALLGAPRARRWAVWWRANVSGVAANVSLGMMLGVAPALLGFFGLPLEVRHVTLSTGQLGAALGALGWPALAAAAFWWCLAGIAVTGILNVAVSFWLAFAVALRARGVRVKERQRLVAAIRRRLMTQPLSFLLPPRG
jgi:site-specific recombinase